MAEGVPNLTQYVVPRLRQVAPLDSLVADELAAEVIAKHNELFEGTRFVVAQQVEEEPIGLVNTIQALSFNALLHEITKGRIEVASITDLVQYWDKPPGHRVDKVVTKDIVLSPLHSYMSENLGDLRRHMRSLVGQSEVPVLFSGLKPVRAENTLGFVLQAVGDLTREQILSFQQDAKYIRYDAATKRIVKTEIPNGVKVLTDLGMGIAGVYARWDRGVYVLPSILHEKDAGIPIIQRKL